MKQTSIGFGVVALAVVSLALVACADPSSEAGAGATRARAAALTPTGTALGVLRAEGNFVFALEESDAAARMRDVCASESLGDSAKSDACYAAASAQGKNEGIRFSVDENGRLVWTSWGIENGKELVHLRAPLTTSSDGARVVVATFAEAPEGTSMSGRSIASTELRFEVPNADTVVMNDPKKGRLVFHRVAL